MTRSFIAIQEYISVKLIVITSLIATIIWSLIACLRFMAGYNNGILAFGSMFLCFYPLLILLYLLLLCKIHNRRRTGYFYLMLSILIVLTVSSTIILGVSLTVWRIIDFKQLCILLYVTPGIALSLIFKRHWRKIAAFLMLILPLLSVLSVGFIIIRGFYSQINKLNDLEKAREISYFVFKSTIPIRKLPNVLKLLRAGNDFLWWVIFGVGACGEMANVGVKMLRDVGLEAMVVAFPGEDHTFAQVKINNTWMVFDPGYYKGKIVTWEQRINDRTREYGNISYIAAYVNGGFIELTHKYIPTDTIIIKVLHKGEPLSSACVTLTHKFLNKEVPIPGNGLCFYADTNGYVTIHLGPPKYYEKASPYEPYFKIIVNGKDSGIKVSSTGSHKTHRVEVNL